MPIKYLGDHVPRQSETDNPLFHPQTLSYILLALLFSGLRFYSNWGWFDLLILALPYCSISAYLFFFGENRFWHSQRLISNLATQAYLLIIIVGLIILQTQEVSLFLKFTNQINLDRICCFYYAALFYFINDYFHEFQRPMFDYSLEIEEVKKAA